MNKTGITKIKIDDSKEHLRVILSEIDIQSKQLGDILKKIEDTNTELESKKETISKYSEYHNNLISEVDNKLTVLSTREEKINKESSLLDSKKIEIEDQLNLIRRDIEKSKKEQEQSISSHLSQLQILTETLTMLNVNVKNIEKKISTTDSLLMEKETYLSELNNEITKKEEEKNTLLISYDRFVKDSEGKMEVIRNNIEIEKSKIENPMKLLAETDIQTKKKQRNLDILIARFRKEFKKLHPDLDPQI